MTSVFVWRPKLCRCSSSVLNLSCILGNRVSPPRRAKASDLHLEAKVDLTASPKLASLSTLETPVAIVFFYWETIFLLEYILRWPVKVLCLFEACIKVWVGRHKNVRFDHFESMGSLTTSLSNNIRIIEEV